MKYIYKSLFFLSLLLAVFLCKAQNAMAANDSENVSVTIPAEISIVFNEDGTTDVSDFVVKNDSLVPITLHSVKVIECNGWKLMPEGTEILANKKQLVFKQENQCLSEGDNEINISIVENAEKRLNLEIGRGVWTSPGALEKALNLEFEYTIGKKEFSLTLEGHKTLSAYNGETVVLPILSKYGAKFLGWEDEAGEVYSENFVMPIGNTKLTPKWQETKVYAVYSDTDQSLTFYNTADEITAGKEYNGKMATAVYTGMDKAVYQSGNEVPWNSYRLQIKSVVVKDEIRPLSMSYWFYRLRNCATLDVGKINTAQVMGMTYTFFATGTDASTVRITGMDDWDVSNVTTMNAMFDWVGASQATSVSLGDLSRWDVSNVTDMFCAFRSIGEDKATSISFGDLSGWDVSKVTDMTSMFAQSGRQATWKLDLSKWNVAKVIKYEYFDAGVESKVTSPKWVN